MTIRRYRLRCPQRCRVLVEPPSEEVIESALRYFGALCGDIGRSNVEDRQMRDCAAFLRFYGRYPGWGAVDVDESLRSGLPSSRRPLSVDLREAIHAVARLGGTKCTTEF